MTLAELVTLDQAAKYHFTLYHGERLFGFAVLKDNSWYIAHPQTYDPNKNIAEIGRLVLPEQIIDCKRWDGNPDLRSGGGGFSYNGALSFKTLVILGAGASHDYCFKEKMTDKPPLTCNLFCDDFSRLMEKYPGVENLSSQLQQAADIETYFQRQWEKVFKHHNQSLLNKLIDVQYYLHDLFMGVSAQPNFSRNNYSAFFQFLHDHLVARGINEKAMVVTFNYDTILEKSLNRSLDYTFDTMDDYVDLSRRFVVLKPHGSCNWIKTIDADFCKTLDSSAEPSMDRLPHLIYKNRVPLGRILQHLSEEITLLPPHNLWSNYYFPQLLIPYKTKDSFVMPDAHTTVMETFMGQVENIFIIGWKGAEEKFKKLLSEKLKDKKVHIRYVNNRDNTVERELRPILPHASFTEVAPHEDSVPTFTGLNKIIHDVTEIFN